jgi:hypothetical protein
MAYCRRRTLAEPIGCIFCLSWIAPRWCPITRQRGASG